MSEVVVDLRFLESQDAVKRDLRTAFDLAMELIDLERASPVRDYRQPEELAEELDLALRAEGQTLEALWGSLRQLFAATPRIASPRFFNLLFGGRDPVATAAEILTVLANTPMHTFKAAGAQVLVEQRVLAHMASKVGFEGGEGMFTAGGSLSNFAALVLARNQAWPEARDDGMANCRGAVYTSAEGHFSIARGMGMAGLGRRQLRVIPIDPEGRMDLLVLREKIAADIASGVRPVMINATAGTTILGAFDPLEDIARVASDHGIWLHVDGAFGGSALLSEEHRGLLRGCELADSFSWDAHKALAVPLSCSVLLLRHRGLLAKSFSESAEYLFQSNDDYDPGQRSMQCARRNDAFKLWAAWRHHGDEGYARRIDNLFALARRAAEMVEADPELQLCHRPQFLNVCFEAPQSSSVEICERLEREARLVVSHVPLNGRRVIRLVCVNPDLTEADLVTFFDEVKAVARSLGREGRPAAVVGA